MQYLLHLESPIGPLTLTEEDGALIRLDFGKKGQAGPETTLLAEAKKQLEQYFSGTLRSFTLPLRPEGTPFQQKVWAALLQIPWGETRTYGQVAAMIGQPKACRAVGMANNRNPLPIFIPCHRVIGANGQLTGYAGGLSAKEHLLSLEQGGR
ncbi:MAG TPA: methylated-DNA--[protein]-cysteine S-methyltransferase [Candidatus Merdivicinus excrementipullorum]|uniref:Methylated-DNA--protein-cysteine methyltransferase n=1 Tax=Candidatus Merdivicinus excrementipullorum TaxID=2840867 RepID=A0A9D1FKM4_9FIRM|nr:methylated-DNA--[protein]-cysteine S-methyltransferase [Candidatus Merdivicinus excrementipullorum]